MYLTVFSFSPLIAHRLVLLSVICLRKRSVLRIGIHAETDGDRQERGLRLFRILIYFSLTGFLSEDRTRVKRINS